MKVAFYTTTILEHGGGLEKYLIETANGLSALTDFQVDIFTMDDEFTEKIARYLSFYYFKKVNKEELYKEKLEAISHKLGNAKYIKCKNFKDLKRKLNEYDIVYSKNELLEAFILKFFIGYKKMPPVVFGCHTPIFYPVANSLHAKIHNFLYNGFIYKWLASGVKAFHVANNSDKELLEKTFPYKKVFRIYNPFNVLQFEQNLRQHSYDFNWDRSKYNVLWIARLTEQKGVSSLIDIVNLINKTPYKDKIVFNIFGSGPLGDSVSVLKKGWDNVNWFGHVEYRYLPSIYTNNDIFISTSKWESLPFNILEAQACGIPAIAFDIPGPQDIITNGKTGFLVDSEQEFCDKVLAAAEGEEKFEKNSITKSIERIFNPKDIYLEISEMFRFIVEKK